ncbi:MAG: site-specific integrase, partial [Actinobacteria bacterium]|nr:site-specific integrase [Actinomycetota bacterium]
MRGHVRKRGSSWSFVADVDGQQSQRCTACATRVWVKWERPGATCVSCGGVLGEPLQERRQVWRSGLPNKRAAEAALRAFLSELECGRDPFPDDTTLRQWVERWKASEAFVRLRPRTRSRYAQVMADHLLPPLGSMRVDRIRPRHVKSALDDLGAKGASARSISEAKAILSSALTQAVEAGLIDVNPTVGIRVKSSDRRKLVVPDGAEARALLQAAEGTVWEVPLALACYTGMRRSEVLGLSWHTVDLEQHTIVVERGLHRIRDEAGSRLGFLMTKTATSNREFAIGTGLTDRLRRWRTEQT